MKKAVPYVCVVCRAKPEAYYGRLVFPSEMGPTDDALNAVAESGGSIGPIPDKPICPNHKEGLNVPLIAVPTS